MVDAYLQKLGEERSAIRELFEYGNRRKAEIGAEKVFDFSLGNPSVPAPRFVREEIERLLNTLPAEELHGYTSAPGLFSVREEVARSVRENYGVPMTPDLVYMTCGAAASLAILFKAILAPGEEIAVLAPFFPEYRVFIEAAGGKCAPIPTKEDFHLDMEALERGIGRNTRAIVVNSPNNPTGVVYGEEELMSLAALLKRKSEEHGEPVLLVADEPYRALVYGKAVPYLPALYPETAVCYSFSKALSLAGERIGYIAISPKCEAPARLFAAVCGAGRALGYVCAPSLFQRVVTAGLDRSTDIGEYRTNRDILYGALTRFGYACVPPDGAFYLFVKAPGGDAKAFCERAKRYELLLVPSESFGIPGYVRISYCVARTTIENSLPAFEKLIGEYR